MHCVCVRHALLVVMSLIQQQLLLSLLLRRQFLLQPQVLVEVLLLLLALAMVVLLLGLPLSSQDQLCEVLPAPQLVRLALGLRGGERWNDLMRIDDTR